jgi:hypothetical protein
MKTFENLEFKPHPLNHICPRAKQAVMDFDNGASISVIIGDIFYSNGIDTYEVLVSDTYYLNGIHSHLTKEEVTQLMLKL